MKQIFIRLTNDDQDLIQWCKEFTGEQAASKAVLSAVAMLKGYNRELADYKQAYQIVLADKLRVEKRLEDINNALLTLRLKD